MRKRVALVMLGETQTACVSETEPHTHTHIHVRTHTHTYMYTHTHIRTHTHTHTHTCTHAHMNILLRLLDQGDGQDAYHLVKAAGRYKEYGRTQGVSTTDLVGRMLLLTKSHFTRDDAKTLQSPEVAAMQGKVADTVSPYTGASQFLPTTKVRGLL